jgi:CDGSH-type Zn-finger protein/uncharacterized Fe-S cluster protein YjdI
MSFTALRDNAALPPGRAARRFFVERFGQLAEVGESLRSCGDPRAVAAADLLASLAKRATRGFDLSKAASAAPAAGGVSATAGAPAGGTAAIGSPPVGAAAGATGVAGVASGTNGVGQQAAAAKSTDGAASTVVNGIETAVGQKMALSFETKRCIHARFCVTGAPNVFLANVKGPWIHPDAMEVERVVEVAHACPSGAITYHRLDGVHDETAPPVNLAGVREAGPYAFRGQLQIDGEPAGFRATLCRCGASKNKPFCDSSHHDVGFSATGEPPTGKTDMLPVRDGVLAIDPEINGPLAVRGNLEITSGTGRVVARVVTTRLCRCGGSSTKPFCDGTHAKIGFKSTN